MSTAHRPHVALVTATAFAALDDDLEPLAEALRQVGIEPGTPAWDDPAVDWSAYDLAVLRSPWDYAARHQEFLAWLERTAAVVPVRNRPEVVRWNTDKRYLLELAAAGVPTIPTRVLEPGDDPPIGWFEGETVVKPVVSAGAKQTARHTDAGAAHRHALELLASGRAVLVQPYQHGVDGHGETALVYLGGQLSHALRKGPILAPDAAPTDEPFAPEDIRARAPSEAEVALAEAALAVAPAELLYARVDCIPGPGGEPVLLELELSEPSLFVAHAPGAASRFAQAVLAALHGASLAGAPGD